MKNYTYVACDFSGNRKEGLKQAACENDVLAFLREQGLTPISVSELSLTKNKSKKTKKSKAINSADLSALCWQLTAMVEGGIPITTAVDTIAEDIESPQLTGILRKVSEKLQKGETFYESLSHFPKVFNKLSLAIILAGETGGSLPLALKRLAEYFENRDKLSKKVKSAMFYPAFILIFIILILVFIMTFIIPKFKMIFDQLGGDLPAFTQSFMNLYDFIKENLIFVSGFLFLVIGALIVLCTKTKKGHYIFSKTMLAIPLVGKILSRAFVSIFCKTMSTLLTSGVSVLEVFDILSTMTNNDIIKDAIVKSRQRIVEGMNISVSLTATDFFPNMVIKMVQAGEESGSLSNVLDKTSEYYERKVDAAITAAMSLLEPIMIVAVGGIVLFIVLALYLPIFTMGD